VISCNRNDDAWQERPAAISSSGWPVTALRHDDGRHLLMSDPAFLIIDREK